MIKLFTWRCRSTQDLFGYTKSSSVRQDSASAANSFWTLERFCSSVNRRSRQNRIADGKPWIANPWISRTALPTQNPENAIQLGDFNGNEAE